MSRILLLGGRGRLGAALARSWAGTHEVSAFARPEVDASDIPALAEFLEARSFDVLVNCIAQTNVDRCETERGEAAAVNVDASRIMAEAATRKDARMIHFSTDYVFDGRKDAPYVETDETNPLSHYGLTKRDGENAVLSCDPRHLVVRVSWVFGPDKPAFIDSLIDRALQNDRVEAIADKISSPTFAEDVAPWIEPFFESSLPGGVYHACNTGACSWRDWGEHALKVAAAMGVAVRTAEVAPLRLADMKAFIAARPVHTPLSVEKLARTTGLTPRPWQEAVEEYIHQKFA